MSIKTVNRGWLKKMAKQGKLICVSSYHYADWAGERGLSKETPVIFGEAGDRTPGMLTLVDDDFSSPVGRARLQENGTIVLSVHSNCNYTFRVKE